MKKVKPKTTYSAFENCVRQLREMIDNLEEHGSGYQYALLEEMKDYGSKGVKYMDKTWTNKAKDGDAWDNLSERIDEI